MFYSISFLNVHERRARIDRGVEGMTAEGKENGSHRNRRRMTSLKLMISLLIALLIVPLATAGVVAAPGDVVLVSSDAAGAQGNNGSAWQRISSNGRYVVFHSTATNLVTPATTGQQVFRKDLLTGEVRLVSADAAGAQGNAASTFPVISDDGRYVAFHSQATNLVTPATSGLQVFRKDLVTGEVKLCSADAAGVQGNGAATYIPDISSDGRYVSFTSESTNLVTPATSGRELFSKDMLTGEVKLCSADAAGAESNLNNGYPSYSCDARYVSFFSNASNLIPGVTGTQIDR